MMHPLLSLMLITLTRSCLAHYRDTYDTKNYIVREEPYVLEEQTEIVECPVCEESEHWMASNERCTIAEGNKTYKKCKLGTYINEVCGNRLDCYSGPGELCTEKREFDMFGKKCAAGYYCNKSLGVCTGFGFTVDSPAQRQLNRFPYTWRRSEGKPQLDSFSPIRN